MDHASQAPSPWVVRFGAALQAGARVLDLACGSGRHARLLASRGLHVVAADRDRAAIAALDGIPGIEPLLVDLEGAPWPFGRASFDAIVVTNYLHRALFAPIKGSLRAGGLLIYETFMAGQERLGKPSNPDFLLRPHELLRAVAPLYVVAFEQGLEGGRAPRVVQRIVASAGEPGFPIPPVSSAQDGS